MKEILTDEDYEDKMIWRDYQKSAIFNSKAMQEIERIKKELQLCGMNPQNTLSQ